MLQSPSVSTNPPWTSTTAGSGWQGVYNSLRQHGSASASSRIQVIATQPGPVILVGHSYGGVVITQAGNDPKVAGLVYIAAFAPDKGESVATLIANPPGRRRQRTGRS